MKSAAIFATAALVSAHLVSSQSADACPVFTACLAANDAFEDSTCDPMLPADPDMWNTCRCYSLANRAECYQQCPPDAGISGQLPAMRGVALSACAAVGLDSVRLPFPAPWDKSGTTGAGSGNSANGASGNANGNANGNGAGNGNGNGNENANANGNGNDNSNGNANKGEGGNAQDTSDADQLVASAVLALASIVAFWV